jgi:hypothetical protein
MLRGGARRRRSFTAVIEEEVDHMSSSKKREFFLRERIVYLRAISFALVLVIAIIAFAASAPKPSSPGYNVTDGAVTINPEDNTTTWTFNVTVGPNDRNQITHTTVAWCGDGTNILSVTVDGIPVTWNINYFEKTEIQGIRIYATIRKGETKPVTIIMSGTAYGTDDNVACSVFSGSLWGPYFIKGPVFATRYDLDLSSCPAISNITESYRLTIKGETFEESVYDYYGVKECVPTTNQYITISNGIKNITIRVLGNEFTCDELVALLTGLDLAHFESLPDVIEIDYHSVDLRVWRDASTDYPDLTVTDLQLITGTGPFELPDLNLSCTGDCFDERIIVGVSLLTQMVQSYEDLPLGFDNIAITEVGGTTTVEYQNDGTVELTIYLNGLVQPPGGALLENVSAAYLVAACGHVVDWVYEGYDAPVYTIINCSATTDAVGKTTVYATYIQAGDEPDELVVELDWTPWALAQVLTGAGAVGGAGSPWEYARIVSFVNVTEGKTNITVEWYLDNDSSEPCVRLELDAPFQSYAPIGSVSYNQGWGSCPEFALMKSYENVTGNKITLVVEWYLNATDEEPCLVVEVDPNGYPSPLVALTLAQGGSNGGIYGSDPMVDSYVVTITDYYTLIEFYDSTGAVVVTANITNDLLDSTLWDPLWMPELIGVLCNYSDFEGIGEYYEGVRFEAAGDGSSNIKSTKYYQNESWEPVTKSFSNELDPASFGLDFTDFIREDNDDDGVAIWDDLCPNDTYKIDPGFCGCGVNDTDSDFDEVPDCIDNCIDTPNPDQLDTDEDGVGDACDNCPGVYNPDQTNSDEDEFGDACDGCPYDSNRTEPGPCGCNVSVAECDALVANITALIDWINSEDGITVESIHNALINKLETISQSISEGDYSLALSQLKAFDQYVKAQTSKKKIIDGKDEIIYGYTSNIRQWLIDHGG